MELSHQQLKHKKLTLHHYFKKIIKNLKYPPSQPNAGTPTTPNFFPIYCFLHCRWRRWFATRLDELWSRSCRPWREGYAPPRRVPCCPLRQRPSPWTPPSLCITPPFSPCTRSLRKQWARMPPPLLIVFDNKLKLDLGWERNRHIEKENVYGSGDVGVGFRSHMLTGFFFF